MALEFNRLVTEAEADDGDVIARERLCLTSDDRVVAEGDPAARWLYAIPGQRIGRADAQRYGLLPAPEPEPEPGSTPKARAKPADKARRKPDDK